MVADPLESDGYLTEFDYEFLAGNKVFWPTWGAALASVFEWCRSKGYGNFGAPTERGRAAMSSFEAAHNRRRRLVPGAPPRRIVTDPHEDV